MTRDVVAERMPKMAKIKFERSGGFLEPLIDFTLDLDSLAPHKAQHLIYLIEDADFFRFPENLVAESEDIDEFIYTITVEAGSNQHSVRVSEMYLSEPLQELVDNLSELVPVP
jgi:Emfourin